MIKILFFLDTLSEGGAEKVLRTLVNNLDRSKFDITVQTVDSEDPGRFLNPGIRYKAINRARTGVGRKLMSYWIRLCAETKWLYPMYIKDDYDIEAAYLECGPTKMLAGSTNQKALKLAWVHCDLEKKVLGDPEKVRRYYETYDKVVCVSQDVRNAYVRLFGNQPEAVVLPNVNDEEEILTKANAFAVEKTAGTDLVAVGRLAREKGFDRLIDACARLQRDGYDFRLQILGEGPERASLEAQIRENRLENRVKLPGFQSNPYPYIKNADLVVCSSRYEGFSTVVTEALILGKPVVTTPCSGMDELLGDSEYGLITGEGAEGLYAGLKAMLDSPEGRARYAQAAKHRGQDFSKKQTVRKNEAFFIRELEQKGDI